MQMKKLIFSLLLLHFFTSNLAQNGIGALFMHLKDSNYVDLDDNGKPYRKYSIINHNIHGQNIYYYPNGKVMRVALWNQGHFDGPITEYTPEGEMARKYLWRNDTLLYVQWISYTGFTYKPNIHSYFTPTTLFQNAFESPPHQPSKYDFYALRITNDNYINQLKGIRIDTLFGKKNRVKKVTWYNTDTQKKQIQLFSTTGKIKRTKCYQGTKQINCN